MKRRDFLKSAAAASASGSLGAASLAVCLPAFCTASARPKAGVSNAHPAAPVATLAPAQSRLFRAWMVRIIRAQLQAGPTPRWQQRDCVGLVRFAVAESLREHDAKWKRANGLAGQTLPPEISLDPAQQSLRHNWRLADGSRSAWVSALELVQENTRFQGKDCNQAQPGDLLFFDQGDAQHLMVWMGNFIAYHTGTVEKNDNGLRAADLRQLQRWPDTRWHPAQDNPNFAGVYRLQFLSA